MLNFKNILYLIIFLIPFSFAFNIQKDIDLASGRFFISLLFVVLFFLILYKGKNIPLTNFKNKTGLYLLLFFVFSFFSVFWSINPVWSLRKVLFFASIFPFYFLIIYLINSKKSFIKASKIFIVSGFIASLIAIFQFLSQFIFGLDFMYKFWAYKVSMFLYGQNFGSVIINNQSWFVNINGTDFFRAISLFPDPHTFALYLGLLIPFTIGFSLYDSKKATFNKKYILYLSVMFLALLFTFSRGAYVALFISTFIILIKYKDIIFFGRLSKNTKKIILSFMLFFVIFLMSIFGQRLLSSFSLDDVSNTGRLSIWKTSFMVFLENPILGSGLGNLPIYFDPTGSVKSPINAHNTFLDILSELGIVGLFLFLSIFFYSVKNKEKNHLTVGLMWSILWFMIHSFFETSIFSVQVLMSLLFILALNNIQHIAYDKK